MFTLAFLGSDLLDDTTAREMTMASQAIFRDTQMNAVLQHARVYWAWIEPVQNEA